jgi:hypothetical protein
MRFRVGQVYPFIHIAARGDTPPHTFHTVRVWYEEVSDITIDLLVCTHHHEVPAVGPNVWTKMDGFIFKDKFGTEWYNQYPLAYENTKDLDYVVYRNQGPVDGIVEMKYLGQYLDGINYALQFMDNADPVMAAKAAALKVHYSDVHTKLKVEHHMRARRRIMDGNYAPHVKFELISELEV